MSKFCNSIFFLLDVLALDKLGKLRDQGVISEEDFEEKKQELLSRI